MPRCSVSLANTSGGSWKADATAHSTSSRSGSFWSLSLLCPRARRVIGGALGNKGREAAGTAGQWRCAPRMNDSVGLKEQAWGRRLLILTRRLDTRLVPFFLVGVPG